MRKPKYLGEILSDGGIIEYRNGQKGVRLKCGWWARVVPKSELSYPKTEENKKSYRASKKDLSALAKIKEEYGDDWQEKWFEYCLKKVMKT